MAGHFRTLPVNARLFNFFPHPSQVVPASCLHSPIHCTPSSKQNWAPQPSAAIPSTSLASPPHRDHRSRLQFHPPPLHPSDRRHVVRALACQGIGDEPWQAQTRQPTAPGSPLPATVPPPPSTLQQEVRCARFSVSSIPTSTPIDIGPHRSTFSTPAALPIHLRQSSL